MSLDFSSKINKMVLTWWDSRAERRSSYVFNGTNYLFACAIMYSSDSDLLRYAVFSINKNTWESKIFYNENGLSWAWFYWVWITVDDALWKVKFRGSNNSSTHQYRYYDFATNWLWNTAWTYSWWWTASEVYWWVTYSVTSSVSWWNTEPWVVYLTIT